MMGLTPIQVRALDIIREANSHGTAPTYDELCVDLGLKSKAGISRIVKGLEVRGAIRRLPGQARALEAITAPEPANLRGLSTRELYTMRDQIDAILRGRAQA